MHAGDYRNSPGSAKVEGARSGALHWYNWTAAEDLPDCVGQVRCVSHLNRRSVGSVVCFIYCSTLSLVLAHRVEPGTVDVILSYCHYCLNDTSLESILPYLEQKGVGVINASILSMGLLTQQVRPASHAVMTSDTA